MVGVQTNVNSRNDGKVCAFITTIHNNGDLWWLDEKSESWKELMGREKFLLFDENVERKKFISNKTLTN